MSSIVTVHSTPNCQQCRGVKRWLDAREVPYAEVNLHDHLELLELFREEGHMQAPIVTYEDIVFSGFNPAALENILRAYQSANAQEQ